MLSKTQFNSLCCYSADRNADCDTTDMFCSIKQHYMIRFILQTFLPAQLKCMRQESVMCKKKGKRMGRGGSCIVHSCSPALYSMTLEVPAVALISSSAGKSKRNQEAATDHEDL